MRRVAVSVLSKLGLGLAESGGSIIWDAGSVMYGKSAVVWKESWSYWRCGEATRGVHLVGFVIPCFAEIWKVESLAERLYLIDD